MRILKDKTILLTGGTGSFGQMFTEVVLKEGDPKSLRIYSRGELAQVQMEQRFHDDRLRFFIGDIRDEERLRRAMKGVDIVVHAAALKHVPVCEYNPIEAIKTNIDGTANVINAAIDLGVDRMMLISTDKAVHPVNLYGATKMVAEKCTIQGNTYSGGKGTRMSCVRYGNVIGSRGSVVPLFLKQRKRKEITITDERMTRFWITLEEGVRFVIQSIARMHGGETFVPKIPSMRITELADIIAPDCTRVITGIRPGEKLHEVLITEDEARHAREFDDHFVIIPEFPFWKDGNFSEGAPLDRNFRYTSENNSVWMTADELRKIVVDRTHEE